LKRQFDPYLKDILEAIRRVDEYTIGLNYNEFEEGKFEVDAVLRNLGIIGEAVSQLQKEIKAKYPDVPWQKIMNFRNVVIHRYWQTNKPVVWDIVQNKLDSLKAQITEILKKENEKTHT
jgi:uncharacterized protein with HEPN domain